MSTRELICIGCPLGCPLTVALETTCEGTFIVTDVTGNTCPKGDAYARKEVTHPTRMVTSTVAVRGGSTSMLNVKTATDIPKDKIQACMEALRGIEVSAPVKIGDVIIENVAGTGVDVVAARNVMTK